MSNCDRRPHLMVLQVPQQDGHLLVAAFLWGYDRAMVWRGGAIRPLLLSTYFLLSTSGLGPLRRLRAPSLVVP